MNDFQRALKEGLRLTPEAVMGHPGLLKLDLIRQGLRLRPEIRAEMGIQPNPHEIFATGLDLRLPGGLLANVPLIETPSSASPYRLELCGESACINYAETELAVPVSVLPPPAYVGKRTVSGRSYNSIVNRHGDFVYIFPFNFCAYVTDDLACAYCHLQPEDNPSLLDGKSIEEVLEVLRFVFRDRAPELVYLSVGQIGEEDGGIARLEPYVRLIKKHFDTLVGIEVMPPQQMSWILRAYAMGADALCFSMGVYDRDLFSRLLPGRAEDGGYDHYLASLKYAASIFPRGAVYTRFMLGLEPIESALMGVGRLTDFGVVPLLPLYRPPRYGRAPVIPPQPDIPFETLVSIYRNWRQTLEEKQLDSYWVRPISQVTMPIDASAFSLPEEIGQKSWFTATPPTGWQRRTHRYGATLRRLLRVRLISDPTTEVGH